MIRTTIASLSTLVVLILFLSLVTRDFAQTRATTVAQRKGLFRRFNHTDAQQTHQHQSSAHSYNDGYGARVHQDIDISDIPKPVEHDELDVLVRLRNLAASQTGENDKPVDSDAPRELDITPIDGTKSDADDEQPEFSPEMIELRDNVRRCLAHYFDIKENAGNRSPWGIMHALIAYGVDTEIYANNQKVNAIGWLCFNGAGRGQRLFYTNNGRLGAAEGPGVQGHAGQFMAMLAQSRVKSDYPIRADGREFTIEDLIKYEKDTCRARSELTFKLIGLSYYLDSDATWENDRGEAWDIPRLIKEELEQPIVGAACGGTHRMMGFSYAVNRRAKQGKEIDGQWHRAKKYVEDFQAYTLALQNPDGSFSTEWFEGRGDANSRDRKLQTTGHILEWMVYSLPQEQLQDPRVVRAVQFLTDLMLEGRNHDWEVGPKGHALHALVLYDQRVFGAEPGNGGPRTANAKLLPIPK